MKKLSQIKKGKASNSNKDEKTKVKNTVKAKALVTTAASKPKLV